MQADHASPMPDVSAHAILRPATAADSRTVALLWDVANAGQVASVFARNATAGVDWLARAATEIARSAGEMSHRNVTVAQDEAGEVAGMLVSLKAARRFTGFQLLRMPADQRPHYELIAQIEGAWFLRDLAVFPAHRGRGIGSALVEHGFARAREAGCETVALTTHETNGAFLARLERRGFRCKDTRFVRSHARYPPESRWILLTCPVPGA